MTEKKKPILALFASGNGTNVQAILDAHRGGLFDAKISVLVSDKQNAYALSRANNAGVETVYLGPKDYEDRKAYDTALVSLLKKRKVDWVILAGFMRILSESFVRPFWGRILNIHPALLPAYPGTHSIERAYKAGEKEVGVTVHFVDEGVDTGPIILQESLEVQPGETLEELTERVHELEHRLYPEAIRKVLAGEVAIPEKKK